MSLKWHDQAFVIEHIFIILFILVFLFSVLVCFCSRNNLNDLEKLSQTDLKCTWSSQHYSQEKYKAVAIEEMPCFAEKWPKPIIQISDNTKQNIISTLLSHAPNSALNINRIGRRNIPTDIYNENKINSEINSILNILMNNSCQSVLLMELSLQEIPLNDCCKAFISENFSIDPVIVAKNTKNSRKEWHGERKFRITGSRMYEIYTYKGSNWIKKNERYFNPKHFTNKFVQHGLKYEDAARKCFMNATKFIVHEFGLIISPHNNWLGYSPDGVIFQDDKPVAVLEIKCPFAGSHDSINNVLKNLDYLKLEQGIYELKENHKYYGQIQTGMALLNLNCVIL